MASRKVTAFLRGSRDRDARSIAGIVALVWMAGGLQRTGERDRVRSSLPWLVSIVLLLFTFAVQSSVEEMLFRGWLLSVLAKKFNVPIGGHRELGVVLIAALRSGQHWLVTVGDFRCSRMFACAWVLRIAACSASWAGMPGGTGCWRSDLACR